MRRVLMTAVATAALALATGPALAQQPAGGVPQDTAEARRMLESQMGTGVSEQDVLRRLEESGLTRSQVRARLQAMGYDSRMADRYFDAMERGDTTQVSGVTADSTLFKYGVPAVWE